MIGSDDAGAIHAYFCARAVRAVRAGALGGGNEVVDDAEWPVGTDGKLSKLSLDDHFEARRLLTHAAVAISEDRRPC
jgi:hypothetical protein